MKKIFTLTLVASTILGFAQAPLTSAGTPSQMASDVISVFSDSYTDVASTNFNPNWSQATVYSAFDLSGDNMLKYATLNYQGIEFGSDIDAAAKGKLHMDIWSDKTADVAIFCISRSTGEKSIIASLTANQWTTVDVDLTDFISQGMSMADLFQFKFDETARTVSPTIYVDNIYFYGTATATEPLLAAANPTHPAANVTSVYSELYDDPAAINYYPNWGQATQYSVFKIGEDSMIRYSALNYQGIDFGVDLDVSDMEYLHFDVWTSGVDSMDVYLINQGPVEKKVTPQFTQSDWTSLDIPLTDYTSQGMTLDKVFQIKLDDIYTAGGTIFIDNIYFYKVPVPMTAAPDPIKKQEDVISIYSETYTDPASINYYPGWGQSTQYSVFEIGMDSIIEYSNLNYQGIEFGETIDASSMDSLHLDVWSTSVSNLEIYLISSGSGEKQVTTALNLNSWNRISIPLSDYTAQSLTMNDLIQFKFVDPDGSNGTIYMDNIYFSKPETNSVPNATFGQFKVYPNPASNFTILEANSTSGLIVGYALQNINGQILISKNINSKIVSKRINTSHLESGIYYLEVSTEQGSYTHKIIVN